MFQNDRSRVKKVTTRNRGIGCFSGGTKYMHNLCDNIIFAFRAKAFVLELNIKSKLERLREFSRKQVVKVFQKSNDSTTNADIADLKPEQQTTRSGANMRDYSGYDEKFWSTVKPNSRKCMDSQKSKILFRLEKVVEERRKLKHKRARFNQLADGWLSSQLDQSDPDADEEDYDNSSYDQNPLNINQRCHPMSSWNEKPKMDPKYSWAGERSLKSHKNLLRYSQRTEKVRFLHFV